ncbi:hypothetical protein TREMEDRAFT_63772 [Tremella mesenterica DSM 1558]|uniref:uncharacterized protein n=1 Tax=Tremella mesenterica (strain ATCC 24925 / CBS 8224 / DSM 1558 / NBRC 9311 / NRRL Y-6157 / RJB 2259-6 / UBC 559-6) TaxID=578456 RepID=UPI0003F49BA1|nr:uncharacterized protein TREMEDRAFT_63772 [Tremella mesenterica DSM 1558]EIW67881.1 hypothetical protein TREMEDRAFT_63772 [Tremella mesenterica DSM 1558]
MSLLRSTRSSLRVLSLSKRSSYPSYISFRPLSTTSTNSKSGDPFPLPLSTPELQSLASRPSDSTQEDNSPWPEPLKREGEDEKTLRARLVYQTRKRGMLEGDLLLSTFARDQLGIMNLNELREFDRLLDEPDWDIYYWSIGKKPPPERWADTELLKKLQRHAKNEGKVVRVMPDL